MLPCSVHDHRMTTNIVRVLPPTAKYLVLPPLAPYQTNAIAGILPTGLSTLKIDFQVEALVQIAQGCERLVRRIVRGFVAQSEPPVGMDGDKGPTFKRLKRLRVGGAYPEMITWLVEPNSNTLEEVHVDLTQTVKCTSKDIPVIYQVSLHCVPYHANNLIALGVRRRVH